MKWIVFYNKTTKKELGRITAHDTFPGEVQYTVELLAHQRKMKESDIAFKTINV